jgi:glucose-1-phosphate cytidylyltransferase
MSIPAVILCGGRGTRFREQTETKPKPMIAVCGKPILWHLMSFYAGHGIRDFILCLGYQGDVIKRYFLDYAAMNCDFTVDLSAPNQIEFHHEKSVCWRVTCVDTGLDAMTGARLKRCSPHIKNDTFLLTYGDGLSDVDIPATIGFHEKHGKAVTVTGVRPQSRFGELVVNGERVQSFSEKPNVDHGYINGGFFVMSRKALGYVSEEESCILERKPLEDAAKDGELMVYRHHGYWQCMDTYRDLQLLEKEWKSGKPPWRTW